jgi:Leucine-rich repeat (LRR) protein
MIDFSDNYISDSSIEGFIDCFAKNKRLQYLNLSKNNVSTSGAIKLLSSTVASEINLSENKLYIPKVFELTQQS